MKVARIYKLGALACAALAVAAFCIPSVEDRLTEAFDVMQVARAQALVKSGCVFQQISHEPSSSAGPLSEFVKADLLCKDGRQPVVMRAQSARLLSQVKPASGP